ncbi:uncharacterized protein [Apostichopus japonicus]|uniref:uncharacterized protein isoform X2 n=1 Tax=Stichopus japonicus TaxID=307972 RepID=UPI003AB1450E
MAKITSLLTSAFVSMVCLFTMCINIAEAETYIEDVFVGLKGANFSSPNFPNVYPNDIRYIWTFITARRFRLLVTFDYLDTEEHYDYITVEEEIDSPALLTWSGGPTIDTPSVHSEDNDIVVKFATDFSVNRTGFLGRVEISSLSQNDFLCLGDYFNCGNGVCLSRESECDLEPNCGNDADDPHRTACEIPCGEESFQCDDGRCIPAIWECDDENDCLDGEDEHQNCYDCGGQFTCLDSSCIDSSWECDGFRDCPFGKDEHELCACLTGFQCNDGTCINNEYECNGIEDCSDGEDEHQTCECTESDILCDDGSCVPRHYQCDQFSDCPRGEDETPFLCGPICPNDISVNPDRDCKFDKIAPGIWEPPTCKDSTIGSFASQCLPHPSTICKDHQMLHVSCSCNNTFGQQRRSCDFRVTVAKSSRPLELGLSLTGCVLVTITVVVIGLMLRFREGLPSSEGLSNSSNNVNRPLPSIRRTINIVNKSEFDSNNYDPTQYTTTITVNEETATAECDKNLKQSPEYLEIK